MGILGAGIIKERIKDIFEEGTYNENCISFASYDLRLDDEEIVVNGEYHQKDNRYPYDKTGGVIVLPARQISIISSIEKLKLADNLCLRVGITFSLSRRGLISLFGPQVDPSYDGKFYAVVYNVSPADIELRKGEKILKMEIHSVEGETVKVDGLSLENPPVFERLPNELLKYKDVTKEDLTADLSEEIERMKKNWDKLNKDFGENSARIEEVSGGYRSITFFGVFLVAASIFGVIFNILLSAASDTNLAGLFGGQLSLAVFMAVIIVFVGGWIATVIMVIKSFLKGRHQ